MVFGRAYGSFSGIALVFMRRGKLVRDLLFVKPLFELLRALVVESVEFWFASSFGKGAVDVFNGLFDL